MTRKSYVDVSVVHDELNCLTSFAKTRIFTFQVLTCAIFLDCIYAFELLRTLNDLCNDY